ncbi:hypothetical protein M3Y94_00153900 [Aphelenchoides besseyi]|nr:hypothetical protein M3Y94_00153900 [Aphelenchoides besseyi]KAI6237135.1 hypothetical protein M3Y95_00233100 [Aphelenchoides besseyi]
MAVNLMLTLALVLMIVNTVAQDDQKNEMSAKRKFNARPLNPFSWQNTRWMNRGRRSLDGEDEIADFPPLMILPVEAFASNPSSNSLYNKDKKSAYARFYDGRPIRNPYSWLNNI